MHFATSEIMEAGYLILVTTINDECFSVVSAGGARCYRTTRVSRTGGTERGRGQ